eukprot:g5187.t1
MKRRMDAKYASRLARASCTPPRQRSRYSNENVGPPSTPPRTPSRDQYVSCSSPLRPPLPSPSLRTPTKTPHKSSVLKRKNRGIYSDRFIPSRSGSHLDIGYTLLDEKTPEKKSTNRQTTEAKDTPSTYSLLLQSEVLGVESVPARSDAVSSKMRSERIPCSPISMFRYNTATEHAAASLNFRNAFSLSPLGITSRRLMMRPIKTKRKIAKVPFKVLDAPALQDDFYLNLVDWSSLNVLAVGLGACVYLWSACTSKVTKLCDLGSEDDCVTSVSWTRRGTHLSVGTNLGKVQIWDASTCQKIRTMDGHGARVGTMAWNAQILASGSRDRAICLRDVRQSQSVKRKLLGHKQEVCGLKWSFDDQQLASGGNDNKLFIWDAQSTTPITRFSEHTAAVKAIAWSPHQHGLLASGGGTADRRIRFWNTLTSSALSCVDTDSQVCNLTWSKNVNEIVSTHGYSLNQIIVWRYPSMQKVATLTGHTYRVLYLAMSPDGQTIVTGAGDEPLRFWNFSPGPKKKEGSGWGTFLLFPAGEKKKKRGGGGGEGRGGTVRIIYIIKESIVCVYEKYDLNYFQMDHHPYETKYAIDLSKVIHPIKTGYLVKRPTRGFGREKRRYFVLSRDLFIYIYIEDGDSDPHSVLHWHEASNTVVMETPTSFIIPNVSKVDLASHYDDSLARESAELFNLHLKADTEDIAKEWCEAFNALGKLYAHRVPLETKVQKRSRDNRPRGYTAPAAPMKLGSSKSREKTRKLYFGSPTRKRVQQSMPLSEKKLINRRLRVISEIATSEARYVADLHRCIRTYLDPLKEQAKLTDAKTLSSFWSKKNKFCSQDEAEIICGNIKQIFQFNQQLLSDLRKIIPENFDLQEELNYIDEESVTKKSSAVARLFIKYSPFMLIYLAYANNYRVACKTIGRISKREVFASWLSEQHMRAIEVDFNVADINTYLIMPVQRLMRYSLLLQELVKNTNESREDWDELKLALGKVRVVAAKVDRGAGKRLSIVKLERFMEMEEQRIEERRILALQTLDEVNFETTSTVARYPGRSSSLPEDAFRTQRSKRMSPERHEYLHKALRKHTRVIRALARMQFHKRRKQSFDGSSYREIIRGAVSIATLAAAARANRRKEATFRMVEAARDNAEKLAKLLADRRHDEEKRNDVLRKNLQSSTPNAVLLKTEECGRRKGDVVVKFYSDGSTHTYKKKSDTNVIRYKNGVRVYLFKDGVQLRKETDGTKIQTSPEGMVLTVRSDGSRSQVNPDGSETHTNKDGTKVTTHPNGVTILRRVDGSRVQTNVDGSTIARDSDGTKKTTYADGTIKTRFPDGHWVQVNVQGVQIVQKLDGTMVQTDTDGTIITIYTDGSRFQESSDGSSVETDAQGMKVYTAVDGRQFVLDENDRLTAEEVPEKFKRKTLKNYK